MSSRFTTGWLMVLALLFFGAGCSSRPSSRATSEPSAEVVTEKLVFTTADTFEIRHTFFGLGGFPSTLWKEKTLERHVTLDAFLPEREASLSWTAEAEQETEGSVKAREAYEAMVAKRKKGEAYPPPPKPSMETLVARGSVEHIDLLRPHTLALPAYWLPGPVNLVGERSAIWLSQDAYQELDRTGATDIYFDVTTQAASELVHSSKTWLEAIKRLRADEATVSKKGEPARARVVGEKMDWPLIVNGKEKWVRVWKAKNDFGELIILANAKNPLILKGTVNPLFPSLRGAITQALDWNTLFGYEIKTIRASLVDV